MANEIRVRQEIGRVAQLIRGQRFGEAQVAAADALAAAGDLPKLVLPAAFAAGEVERQLGSPDRALVFFARALAASQAVGVADREQASRSATCHLAWAETAVLVPETLPEAVEEVVDAAEELAARADDRALRARVCLLRARIRLAAGAEAAALREVRAADVYFGAASDAETARLRAQAAEIAAHAGAHELSLEWLNLAWSEAARDAATGVAALVGLARLSLARGRAGEALTHARAATAVAEPLGAQARIAAWKICAEANRAAGLPHEAARCADRLPALWDERGGGDPWIFESMLLAIDLWLDVEAWDQAELGLARAAPLAGALDATRGGAERVRALSERRARWFVERCTVSAAWPMAQTA